MMLSFSVFLVLLLSSVSSSVYVSCYDDYSRLDFPADFVFGAGSSAYQVEGAAKEDGRTPSIWDTFVKEGPSQGGNGDTTSDQYHKYKEDVKLMVDLGLDAYRLSISWSRLIPNGRGAVNPKGLEYYNNLITELVSNGIEPHVTLHHSDLPQCLEDEYGGWIDRRIIDDFTAYANTCFHHFGDRVSHWTTLNEANVFVLGGYDGGFMQPKHCSPQLPMNCKRGNSSTEPYLATHYMLLAHGSVAKLYREKYQEKQNGQVGINLFGFSVYPFTNTTDDIKATERAYEFLLGWYMNPLVFGDYPSSMKETVGARLPAFTTEEAEMVKGSAAFIGLNYYYSGPVKHKSSSKKTDFQDFFADIGVEMMMKPPGPRNILSPFEFPVQPWGLQILLEHFKETYGNPPIYIHENGQAMTRNISKEVALNDTIRVNYMKGYIGGTLDAIRNGSNTRGYFYWSFVDMVELLFGYSTSFGLYYIDTNDADLVRYPKLSAHWYSNFLKGGNINNLYISEISDGAAHQAQ